MNIIYIFGSLFICILYMLLAWDWMSQNSEKLSEQLFTSNETDFLMLIVALFAYLGALRFAGYALKDNKKSQEEKNKIDVFLDSIERPDTIYCILSMIVLYDLSVLWLLNASHSFLPKLPDFLNYASYFIKIRSLLILLILGLFVYASILLMKKHFKYYSNIKRKKNISLSDSSTSDDINNLKSSLNKLGVDEKHVLLLIANDHRTPENISCQIFKHLAHK